MAAIDAGEVRHTGGGLLEAVGGVMAMMAAGIVAGVVVFAATMMLTDMAPMLAAMAAAAAWFAVAHYVVHERRRVDPVQLLIANFVGVWALLFIAALGFTAMSALSGGAGGPPTLAVLLGPPVLAALLTALPALAVGDRGPGA